MLLTVDRLDVSYGVIAALRGVCLEIDRGEIVALIGANGAGKTTLLNTLSGLLRPRRGEIILLDGPAPIPLHGMPAHQTVRHGISHVLEGRQIFANLTVRENLLPGGYPHPHRAEVRKWADQAYKLFPVLGERREQRAGTLSGGEQQMLAIARALMAKPKLLLLDELSLGLAPLIVQNIFQIIRDINADGTTIFLVEQNAHMALGIARRAYVLLTGQIVQTGPAAALLDDPQVKQAYLGG